MDYIELGRVLQEARIALGLKQIEVAKQLGCTSANISSWERGKSKIDIDSFAELCKIYKLDFGKTLESLNKGSTTVSRTLTLSEQNHIGKYRSLDLYGKEVVDSVLEIEYKRCSEQNTNTFTKPLILTTVAARSENNNTKIHTEYAEDLSKYTPDDTEL